MARPNVSLLLAPAICVPYPECVPVYHECQRCTACCRWPGQVRVNDDEIARMAAFLGIGETDFIERYTRLRQDRKGLALVEKSNFECVFLDGINCLVQPVKPAQCDGFPNRWNFPGFEKECRSTPREVGEDEYRRLIDPTPVKEDPHSAHKPPITIPCPPRL